MSAGEVFLRARCGKRVWVDGLESILAKGMYEHRGLDTMS